MKIKSVAVFPAALLILFLTGCGPALVGTAAVGTYKGATDKRTVGGMIDDSVISTRVKTGLYSDDRVSGHSIDVDVLKGVVYLTGVVQTQNEKETAGKLAAGVRGVRRVSNQLMVGSKTVGQTMDDTIIGSRVKGALIKEPGLRSFNIDVDVNQGVVTLTGILSSSTEKDKALAIAAGTRGARKVVDNLKVSQ